MRQERLAVLQPSEALCSSQFTSSTPSTLSPHLGCLLRSKRVSTPTTRPTSDALNIQPPPPATILPSKSPYNLLSGTTSCPTICEGTGSNETPPSDAGGGSNLLLDSGIAELSLTHIEAVGGTGLKETQGGPPATPRSVRLSPPEEISASTWGLGCASPRPSRPSTAVPTGRRVPEAAPSQRAACPVLASHDYGWDAQPLEPTLTIHNRKMCRETRVRDVIKLSARHHTSHR